MAPEREFSFVDGDSDVLADGPATVLVVDDLASNVELVRRLLTRDGYQVAVAASGEEALHVMDRARPDLVLLDVLMPGVNGYDVCRAIKSQPRTRLTPVVMITALGESDHRIEGIDAGADEFITKPIVAAELRARVRSLIRLKRYTDELDSAESIILSLALTIEARDPYTDGHCQRLATYATVLGRYLGLKPVDLAALYRGGYLHDVGKIGVPDLVLHKTGPLTADEFAVMKQHTVIGDRLCGELKSLSRVRPIVRHHHERLDGSGYPDGLAGDEIPLLAQIIGVVDVYDALTTHRPYRAALEPTEACRLLAEEVTRGWRGADIVAPFIQLVRNGALDHGACGCRASA